MDQQQGVERSAARGVREKPFGKRPLTRYKVRLVPKGDEKPTAAHVELTCAGSNDRRLAEVWIDLGKEGWQLRHGAKVVTQLVSKLLQYGCPLADILSTLKGNPSSEAGRVECSEEPDMERPVNSLWDAIAAVIEYGVDEKGCVRE